MTLNQNKKYWRIRIFIITWLAYAGFYLCRKNYSVAMPILARDMGVSKDEMAIAITLYSLMYMIGQFINGYLNDRVGPRIVVSAGIGISVLANIFMGWTDTIALFALLMGINGFGQSTGWSGTVKNMTPWFRKKERGTIMSFWTTNYVIGGIAATALATFWLSNTTVLPELGWKRVFIMPAILLIVIGILYATLTRNKPTEVTDIAMLPTESDKATLKFFKKKNKRQKLPAEILKSRAVWTAASAYFFVKFTRYAFLFWLPLYFSEALNYSDNQAGYSSIAYEAVGFFGIFAAGFISDRYFKSKRFPIAAIMLIGLAVALFVQPTISELGAAGAIISIGLIGFFTYGPDSILSGAAAMDIGKDENAALAAGIINGVGSLGQLISPLVVAFVSHRLGWDYLFNLFVILSLIAAIIAASQWNYGSKKNEKTLGEATPL